MTEEKIFYESEILDDDIDAPVGILVNSDDGKNGEPFVEITDEDVLSETAEQQTEDTDETIETVGEEETAEAQSTQTEDTDEAIDTVDEEETADTQATQSEDTDETFETVGEEETAEAQATQSEDTDEAFETVGEEETAEAQSTQSEDIDEAFETVGEEETADTQAPQSEDTDEAFETVDEEETADTQATQSEDADEALEPIKDDTSEAETDGAVHDVENNNTIDGLEPIEEESAALDGGQQTLKQDEEKQNSDTSDASAEYDTTTPQTGIPVALVQTSSQDDVQEKQPEVTSVKENKRTKKMDSQPKTAKKTATPKSKLTVQADGEDKTSESTHAKSKIGISNLSSNVQSILGSSDFSIKESKPQQKTMTTSKKHVDTWAVARLDGKNVSGKAQSPAAKSKKQNTKTAAATSQNTAASEATAKSAKSKAKTAAATPQNAAASEAPAKSAKSKAKTAAATPQNTAASEAPAKSKAKTTKSVNKNSMEGHNMAKEKETVKAKAESGETVIVEGTQGVPHGKFVIKRTDNDNFVFKLFSSNRRVVAVAAGQYSSLGACKVGIQSVINNAATAPIEDQTLKNVVEQKCPKWIIYNDKRGEVRLRLISANGNMVAATNDGYLSKDAAKKGIEAIARAAQGADIVRNDDLW